MVTKVKAVVIVFSLAVATAVFLRPSVLSGLPDFLNASLRIFTMAVFSATGATIGYILVHILLRRLGL